MPRATDRRSCLSVVVSRGVFSDLLYFDLFKRTFLLGGWWFVFAIIGMLIFM